MSEVQRQTAALQEVISRDAMPRLERLADELIEVARGVFERRVQHNPDDGADLMALSFTTKQIEHLQSVRTLIANTCHRDALLIARTMIEGLGKLLWAFDQVPERTDLWLRFGFVLDWRRIVKFEQKGKTIVDAAQKADLKAFLDTHGPAYYKKAVRSAIADAAKNNTPYQIPDDPWENAWTKTSVKEMFADVGGAPLYETVYGESSEWIHWNPRALVGAMKSAEWGTEGFTEEDWRAASMALKLAWQSLWQSLVVLNLHFSLGLDDRLNALGDDLERELSAAIATGKQQQENENRGE